MIHVVQSAREGRVTRSGGSGVRRGREGRAWGGRCRRRGSGIILVARRFAATARDHALPTCASKVASKSPLPCRFLMRFNRNTRFKGEIQRTRVLMRFDDDSKVAWKPCASYQDSIVDSQKMQETAASIVDSLDNEIQQRIQRCILRPGSLHVNT